MDSLVRVLLSSEHERSQKRLQRRRDCFAQKWRKGNVRGERAIEEFFIVQRKQAALSGLPAQGADKKGKQEGEALGKGEGKPYARKAPHP